MTATVTTNFCFWWWQRTGLFYEYHPCFWFHRWAFRKGQQKFFFFFFLGKSCSAVTSGRGRGKAINGKCSRAIFNNLGQSHWRKSQQRREELLHCLSMCKRWLWLMMDEKMHVYKNTTKSAASPGPAHIKRLSEKSRGLFVLFCEFTRTWDIIKSPHNPVISSCRVCWWSLG